MLPIEFYYFTRALIRVVLTEFQLASEMTIDLNEIYVRKLPNTRIRKDIEIARLKDYELLYYVYEIQILFSWTKGLGRGLPN